ncbi:MAG: hypothetical protein VYE27_03335 [Pseudomonadota bacterium]|nr:hypothetical protein [Pseudomonadota bacterium]
MAIMFKIGIFVTFLGFSGLIACIIYGFKIRNDAKRGLKSADEIKILLTRFSSFNMLSLMISLLGVITLTFSVILK